MLWLYLVVQLVLVVAMIPETKNRLRNYIVLLFAASSAFLPGSFEGIAEKESEWLVNWGWL